MTRHSRLLNAHDAALTIALLSSTPASPTQYGKWFPMISAGHTLKECSHCEVIIQLIASDSF